MSNLSTPTSSGERLSFYKLFSAKNYIVEIPIIQRDYAQGRASEQEVRASFLDALKQMQGVEVGDIVDVEVLDVEDGQIDVGAV